MSTLDLDTLLTLEHQGWDALSKGTGGTFYGELTTDDALMVLVNGFVMDRATVVASLDQAPTWDGYEITEPRRVDMGEQTAALVYRARAHRGDEPPFEALMTSVYVLTDGAPRLALYTQTTATH